VKASPKRTSKASKRPATVEEYLAAVAPEARPALAKLRRAIKAAAPGSSEVIAWRMPVVRHEGRQLVGFAAFRDHCSFFVMSADVMRAHAAALKGHDVAAGTVRFGFARPLPVGLVRTLVKARVAENRALSGKRRGTTRSKSAR